MKITAIGEILIDLTQTHMDENGAPRFAAHPGGAPANVAVAARDGLNELCGTEISSFIRFANKAASLTTSRPGAIPAMPTLQEVEDGLV